MRKRANGGQSTDTAPKRWKRKAENGPSGPCSNTRSSPRRKRWWICSTSCWLVIECWLSVAFHQQRHEPLLFADVLRLCCIQKYLQGRDWCANCPVVDGWPSVAGSSGQEFPIWFLISCQFAIEFVQPMWRRFLASSTPSSFQPISAVNLSNGPRNQRQIRILPVVSMLICCLAPNNVELGEWFIHFIDFTVVNRHCDLITAVNASSNIRNGIYCRKISKSGRFFFFSKKKNMINRKYDPFRLNDQIERSIPKWEVVVHPWKSLSSRVKTRNGNCLNSSTWFHKEAEWRADCFWIESNPLHRSRWRMLNGSIKTLSVTWSMLGDGGTIWQSSNLTKRKRTNTWNV